MTGLRLDELVRAELTRLRSDPNEEQHLRDRAEMVLLSLEGWTAPRIAQFVGCSPATVRRILKAFRRRGVRALHRELPGPRPDSRRRRRVERALDSLLAEPRAWTSRQLSAALEGSGIHLGSRQVRRYLAEMGEHWRRTKHTLAHRQQPDAVAAARRRLLGLKKSPHRAIGPVLPR